MIKPSKAKLVSFIKNKLATDPTWALRALVLIHNNQTYEEQRVLTTKDDNGIGFNGFDAAFLSSLAQQYETRKVLSYNQMQKLHKSIQKYAGQVLQCGNKEKLENSYQKSLALS